MSHSYLVISFDDLLFHAGVGQGLALRGRHAQPELAGSGTLEREASRA